MPKNKHLYAHDCHSNRRSGNRLVSGLWQRESKPFVRSSDFVRYVFVWLSAKTLPEQALSRAGTRTLLATFLTASAMGGLYEIAKDFLYPHITLRQSQFVTVVVIGLAAAVTHYFVERGRAALLAKRDSEFRLLFANNPLPMWLYDKETLRFLEVNDAAVAHYGYSRLQFAEMSVMDIRPAEDVPLFNEKMRRPRPAFEDRALGGTGPRTVASFVCKSPAT